MKRVYVSGTVLAAMITVACGGAQNPLRPTVPAAADQGANALGNGGNQAVPDCTPPEGADSYFPAPPGSTLPPEGQPSCETRDDEGGGPSTHTGGTPSTNPSGPPPIFRPRP